MNRYFMSYVIGLIGVSLCFIGVQQLADSFESVTLCCVGVQQLAGNPGGWPVVPLTLFAVAMLSLAVFLAGYFVAIEAIIVAVLVGSWASGAAHWAILLLPFVLVLVLAVAHSLLSDIAPEFSGTTALFVNFASAAAVKLSFTLGTVWPMVMIVVVLLAIGSVAHKLDVFNRNV